MHGTLRALEIIKATRLLVDTMVFEYVMGSVL